MAKIITIEIDVTGDLTVDLEGYDKGCVAVQAGFTRVLEGYKAGTSERKQRLRESKRKAL